VAPAFGTSAMSMKSDQYRRERSLCSDKFTNKYLDCSYFYETATIELQTGSFKESSFFSEIFQPFTNTPPHEV
jgi:hypothetical protein